MAHTETAYAKLNLALHIRKRREDGYHELETLFAFVDAGDRLVAQPASRDEVRAVGEFAPALDDPFSNLVLRALGVLPRAGGLSVMLEKNLPVAAGLGGGSADAGAVFRIVEAQGGLPDDWRERAARLGADVPACVASVPCVGRGTGAELEPLGNDMAGTPVLLINPRVPLPTRAVFAAWDGIDQGPLEGATMRDIASAGRNDLEAAALPICPRIGEVMRALQKTEPWLSRMSGSGATCFALYADTDSRDRAALHLRRANPGWWTFCGALR
jgi:4-diphosphocytidyl-2-C-methyl-D-erythritol kinase